MPHAVETFRASVGASPSTDTKPLVAVIGVGFVGTGLVDSFSSAYNVVGFDISKQRIYEVSHEFLARPNVTFTTVERDLQNATHFLVSVPTLLIPDKSVDLSYLKSALRMIEKWALPGSTVVIESSVAIGLTRKLLGPIAASRGFFAGMSPERIDPGRTEPPMRSIPKVVSGLDDVIPGSSDAITRLYGRVFEKLVLVSKPEVAEMTKLYENCQRMMCIAFANEMSDACTSHGIDPFEVCTAAGTKPFGYMPFAPSLGVGGHCIPVNPYYLLSNSEFPLLEAATERMNSRPARIAHQILEDMGGMKNKRDSGILICKHVLVVGVGFKAGQSHVVNSPGLKLAAELSKFEQVDVMFADPLVSQSVVPGIPRLPDQDWTREKLGEFDVIIVAFRQWGLDFSVLETLTSVSIYKFCN
ncbi:hypothetical protein EDB81DRAFT_646692 [Dactylonectria macrodidyma]|uniref:Nucleotide sugar dehydrogenase n=1 Tax=Dactylonectria macrodidyma TaxID=307937 RepID=A0A9P9J862_9HYPO|nr:hypothetical protein EDB81DRAFT_646692 [Dactylonectria macrodidyma]